MEEEDNNRISRLNDFLRYTSGEMTDRERNIFERELQKDPFLEEAAEGLSGISSENVNEDLADMKKQLKTRISQKNRFVYYRIAASVAVLMIVGSVFYYLAVRNITTRESEEIASREAVIEIPESKPIKEPPAEVQKSEYSGIQVTEKKAERPANQTVPDETHILAEEVKQAAVTKAETIVRTDVKAVPIRVTEDKSASPVAAKRKYISESLQVSGKIISSEDNLPLAGVNVMVKGTTSGTITDAEGKFNISLPNTEYKTLVAAFIGMESKEFQANTDTAMEISMNPSLTALSEVVVVGYGTSKKYDYAETGYLPPQPAEGKRSFSRYIEENIKIPGTLPFGQKAVVILGFKVSHNGDIDSIKVIRSPGIEFSNEAIRLIREGPSWKPAEENGQIIDDDVRVRIVFR